jgi:hypothetical protein
LPSPNCHSQGCTELREAHTLCCAEHRKPQIDIEAALLTILVTLDKEYRLAVAAPEMTSWLPDEVAALRAGRALFGIVDEEV